MQDIQKIKSASQKSQKLLLTLQQKIRTFAGQNQQALCLQQKKILKLFNYTKWQQFMKWIEQKLSQSGDVQQSKLSQISQQQAQFEESIQQNYDKNNSFISQDKSQSQLLAIENSKLRKQNINLQNKIEQISNFYNPTPSRSYFKK